MPRAEDVSVHERPKDRSTKLWGCPRNVEGRRARDLPAFLRCRNGPAHEGKARSRQDRGERWCEKLSDADVTTYRAGTVPVRAVARVVRRAVTVMVSLGVVRRRVQRRALGMGRLDGQSESEGEQGLDDEREQRRPPSGAMALRPCHADAHSTHCPRPR